MYTLQLYFTPWSVIVELVTFNPAVVGGKKKDDSLWTFEQLREDMK